LAFVSRKARQLKATLTEILQFGQDWIGKGLQVNHKRFGSRDRAAPELL
jgi:hypothetical protein